MTSDAPGPFHRIGPARPLTPVVISVPHAGRHYPAALAAESAVPLAVLEQLEDRHADRLVGPAVEAGAVAIVAQVARAWIDLNRAPDEVERPDGAGGPPPSARVRSGLGLVPSRLGAQALRRGIPTEAAVAARLATVHEPYHRAVAAALAAAVAVHGRALLIDCHSMPPLRGSAPAQLVIGDLHGRSADPAVVAALAAAGRAAGYRTAVNRPYAGAYTLARHAVRGRIDAVQVEVDRAAYLDAALHRPSPGLARAADLIAALCLCGAEAQRPPAIAAE